MATKSVEETIQRLEELEKRLRVVEDIEQIKQLHITYVNRLMLAKYDEIMDCFAENSRADLGMGPVNSKAEIEKFFREKISQFHVGKEGDIVVHPIISVDGDKAKGNWLLYLMYANLRTWQSLFWVQGFYDAEYVRENGKWKFSFLKWRQRLAPPGIPPDWDLYNFPGK